MKLLAALCAVALGSRVDVNVHGPGNEESNLRLSYDTFMGAKLGEGKMTPWTGAESFTVLKRRRINAAIGMPPYWEIHKGASPKSELDKDKSDFTWKSWWNPLAPMGARRSVRQGTKKGPTVNRIHYNQLRRLRARVRAFVVNPGNRGQTYYTMSLLGWFGKIKDTEKELFFKQRIHFYNMGVGKCSGSFKVNQKCKGQLYQARAYNFGYEVKIFKNDKEVASAVLEDSAPGSYGKQYIDNYWIGEKKRYNVKVEAGQDNMAVAEFIGFIVDLEEYSLVHFR